MEPMCVDMQYNVGPDDEHPLLLNNNYMSIPEDDVTSTDECRAASADESAFDHDIAYEDETLSEIAVFSPAASFSGILGASGNEDSPELPTEYGYASESSEINGEPHAPPAVHRELREYAENNMQYLMRAPDDITIAEIWAGSSGCTVEEATTNPLLAEAVVETAANTVNTIIQNNGPLEPLPDGYIYNSRDISLVCQHLSYLVSQPRFQTGLRSVATRFFECVQSDSSARSHLLDFLCQEEFIHFIISDISRRLHTINEMEDRSSLSEDDVKIMAVANAFLQFDNDLRFDIAYDGIMNSHN